MHVSRRHRSAVTHDRHSSVCIQNGYRRMIALSKRDSMFVRTGQCRLLLSETYLHTFAIARCALRDVAASIVGAHKGDCLDVWVVQNVVHHISCAVHNV